jgi:hypothetical protein
MNAVRSGATLGEISDAQLKVYGVWRQPIAI